MSIFLSSDAPVPNRQASSSSYVQQDHVAEPGTSTATTHLASLSSNIQLPKARNDHVSVSASIVDKTATRTSTEAQDCRESASNKVPDNNTVPPSTPAGTSPEGDTTNIPEGVTVLASTEAATRRAVVSMKAPNNTTILTSDEQGSNRQAVFVNVSDKIFKHALRQAEECRGQVLSQVSDCVATSESLEAANRAASVSRIVLENVAKSESLEAGFHYEALSNTAADGVAVFGSLEAGMRSDAVLGDSSYNKPTSPDPTPEDVSPGSGLSVDQVTIVSSPNVYSNFTSTFTTSSVADGLHHKAALWTYRDTSGDARSSASEESQKHRSGDEEVVKASATDETDLTLTPAENESFRHSRRFSKPLIVGMPVTASQIKAQNDTSACTPPSMDHRLVQQDQAFSYDGPDDGEQAYISAAEDVEEEGYLTAEDESVVAKEPLNENRDQRQLVVDVGERAQVPAERAYRTATSSMADEGPDQSSTQKKPSAMNETAQRNVTEALSFGPVIEGQMLYRLAQMSTSTPEETAMQVFQYLQKFPARYHIYALDYLAHRMIPNVLEAPCMVLPYAAFCRVLQDLLISADAKIGQDWAYSPTAAASNAWPMALLEESRKALIEMCEVESDETGVGS